MKLFNALKPTFLLLLLFIGVQVIAQNRKVTGTVKDATGSPLPGVNVQLVGTLTGTTTDFDGKYEISLDREFIRFSYVGFIEQIVNPAGKSVIDITLEEDIEVLNEVVVVGYGTQKKKDITTAVAVVDEKSLKDRPLISAAEGLQGKAAGVQVVQPSGKPGAALAVRVRGTTSALATNEPLYVVDGFQTRNLDNVNPSDIVSMSVLKDASAAAIYGVEGANGVVIITTRRGEDNKSSIRYSAYYGLSDIRQTIDVLNTKQYRTLMEEIIPGGVDPSKTDFNNWQDKVFSTGSTQSHQVSVSGGTAKMHHYISLGYLSDQGIVNPARFDRITSKINIDNEVNDWFKFSTNINLMNLDTKDTPDNASSGRGGVIMSALNTPPFLNVYKDDGSGWYDPNPFQPSWENPIAYMEGPDQRSVDKRLNGSFAAEFKLMKNLQFKSNFGIDFLTQQYDYYLDPFRTTYGRSLNGIGNSNKQNTTIYQWENMLTYSKNIEKHSFTALGGSGIRKLQWNGTFAYGTDFPANTDVKTINAANKTTGSTSRDESASASFFGQATYNYNSVYYLTASLRYDGSSKLANKWDYFPSISAGYRVSTLDFIKEISLISDLKIRGGYGKTGNQDGVPNYSQWGLYGFQSTATTNPLSGPSLQQITFGNPDLRWETTYQSNIGFDLSMFNYRVNINFDAYIKETENVLLNVVLPSTTGPVTEIKTNAGNIRNKGIEFNISTVNFDKKFRWTTDFNMSFNRNKVTELTYTKVYYSGRIYSNNQDVTVLRAGLPLGSFFGYVADGVDPETGNMRYKDLNNNGIFDTGDRTVIGNPQPDFIFGLTNSFSYKKFDLNFFIQGSYGNDIYNATRIDLEGMFDSKNQSTAVLDRWQQPGDITDIPKAGNINNVRNSTRFIEDGSYVRLKSVTLSYRVFDKSSKVKFIKDLSVYVTGRNLITLTKYSGFDPEVNAFGTSAITQGIDYGTYPQSRSVVLGLNVEF